MKTITKIALITLAMFFVTHTAAGEIAGLPAHYPKQMENFGYVEMIDLESGQAIVNDTLFNVARDFVVNSPNNTTAPLASLKPQQLVAYEFNGNEMLGTPTLTRVWILPARITLQVLQQAQQED